MTISQGDSPASSPMLAEPPLKLGIRRKAKKSDKDKLMDVVDLIAESFHSQNKSMATSKRSKTINSSQKADLPAVEECLAVLDEMKMAREVTQWQWVAGFRAFDVPYNRRGSVVMPEDIGGQGSGHDAGIMMEIVVKLKFLLPPPGKYYVIDVGYPIRGVFWNSTRERTIIQVIFMDVVSSRKEPFERHPSVWSVIERCFSVQKNGIAILRLMPNFSIYKQADIVLSCFVLHNLIKIKIISILCLKSIGMTAMT
ncbi:hypothetical protein CRG98_015597 [Punica granatum]|uniref:DDE Tnp4 domain-containing protein n=1 Tax=Punica granatum TaxID=22663 RepID=A0A2I0K629_PUNGR|nr:hypothetical protein CRG98_015597 [Punica granatum]